MAENSTSVENKIRDIFIQCLVFNKTIIPLTLVGYELMIAGSVIRTGLVTNHKPGHSIEARTGTSTKTATEILTSNFLFFRFVYW